MGDTSPDELFNVLEALKPALKSVDIRTLAVKSDDSWQNLITSTYFTEKLVDEVQKEQSKLPKLRNNHIVLLSKTEYFNNEIFKEIIEGTMTFPTEFGRNKVQFRKFDPFKLKVRSEQVRIAENLTYMLTTSSTGDQKEREKLWSIVDNQHVEAKRQGSSDMNNLIRQNLKIEYNNRELKDFEIKIPSLAQIEKVNFKDSNLEVEIKVVNGLTGLQLNVKQERSGQGRWNYPIWNDIRLVKEISGSAEIHDVVDELFQINDLVPDDLFTFELINRETGLTLDYSYNRAPLKNVVEPFLKTVDAFCSLENFQDMLFNPYNYRKPDKVFENAVTWLLSIAGYSTVYLGVKIQKTKRMESFDVLRTETGYEIGCADVIAYEDNQCLLLLDCDIGSPNIEKIKKIIETTRYISKKINSNRLKIVPVLVTPKEFSSENQDFSILEAQEGLKIINREKLEIILKSIVRGDRKSARNEFYYW